TVALIALFAGLGLAREMDGILGQVAGGVVTTLYAGIAMVAGLFIARQFLAPPWWRLNAWEPSFNRTVFGIGDAARWIIDDIAELRASMRLIDQVVVFVCIPFAGLNAMAFLGVERVLAGALV